MNRLTISLALGAALVGGLVGAGLASGTLSGRGPALLPPAFAGGLVQEAPGRYVTASPDGDALYYWVVGGGNGTVTRYDWNTAEALTRRVMAPLRDGTTRPATAKVDPDDNKELKVSGVIWTPDARTRTAIVNGQIVREGEVVTGKSVKLYKVIKIHEDREIEFADLDEGSGK